MPACLLHWSRQPTSQLRAQTRGSTSRPSNLVGSMTTLEAVASGANQNIDPLQPGTLPWVEIHQETLTLSSHRFNLMTERISGTSCVLSCVFSRIYGLKSQGFHCPQHLLCVLDCYTPSPFHSQPAGESRQSGGHLGGLAVSQTNSTSFWPILYQRPRSCGSRGVVGCNDMYSPSSPAATIYSRPFLY